MFSVEEWGGKRGVKLDLAQAELSLFENEYRENPGIWCDKTQCWDCPELCIAKEDEPDDAPLKFCSKYNKYYPATSDHCAKCEREIDAHVFG